MVDIYVLPNCYYCEKTKGLMDILGIEYQEYDLLENEGILEEARERGFMVSPIVVDGDFWWSGFDEEAIRGLVLESDDDWGDLFQ